MPAFSILLDGEENNIAKKAANVSGIKTTFAKYKTLVVKIPNNKNWFACFKDKSSLIVFSLKDKHYATAFININLRRKQVVEKYLQ